MTDVLHDHAVDILESEKKYNKTYSFCTLVTDKNQYLNMIRSFEAVGFNKTNSEFLYIDNSSTNYSDGYSGINLFLARASGRYILLCHQDLIAIDKESKLCGLLKDLESLDKNWAIAANAGYTEKHKPVLRISDKFGLNQSIGNFPEKVVSVDENFIIVKSGTNIRCSSDLNGFHLYGADLVTQAMLAGINSYVIDFHLEHLGLGATGTSFYDCQIEFEEKYKNALKPRRLKTNSTETFLGQTHMFSRFLSFRKKRKSKLVVEKKSKERLTRRIKKWLWSKKYRNGFPLEGTNIIVPATTQYSALKAIVNKTYEAPERNLVKKFLPTNLPVVELGGSFGVVTRVIRNKLDDKVKIVSVEANSELAHYCRTNCGISFEDRNFTLLNAAVDYSGSKKVAFKVTEGFHDSHLTSDLNQDGAVEVEAITLGGLLSLSNIRGAFSLVCDIEGAEFSLFENDSDALSKCKCAIIELHPEMFVQIKKSQTEFLALVERTGLKVVATDQNVIVAIRQ